MARIYLIEDDALFRQDFSEVLVDLGHSVVGCASTWDAMAMLAQEATPPDLVLMDLHAPGTAGFCDQCRSSGGVGSALVIVSGDARAATVARELGAAGWLRKPFSLEQLRTVLASCGPQARGRATRNTEPDPGVLST